MLFDNQNYENRYDEAFIAKNDNYFGYKFRPKLPISNLSHFQRMRNPPKINIKSLEKFSTNLRKKVGDNFKIMIDLGCRLSEIKETEYLFKMFKEQNYYFVEEPFRRKINEYMRLKNHCLDVNISGVNIFIRSMNLKNGIIKKYLIITNLILICCYIMN